MNQWLSFARFYKFSGYPPSAYSPQIINSAGRLDPTAPESQRSLYRILFCLLFGLIFSNIAHSQCTLNSNSYPKEFFGNTSQFSLTNGVLVSNIPNATSKQFAVAMQKCTMDSNTWLEVTFSIEINPSSANYLEAYFHCDSMRQNGWIIRMGDTDDDIQLILRKNGISQTILKGAKGYFNRSKSNVILRIVKQPEQIIVLYKDSAWENFQCLGAGIDTMPNLQSYHGWSITQSGSSAAGKHKVEQWYIGPPRPDRKPPQLINTLWTQPNTARLQFSEPIQIPQRQQFISNYRAADSISIINSRIIIVKFPKVHCNQYNTIHCQNLLDTANNVAPHLLDSSIAECATPIFPNQIIFTEIMVDPTPQVGYLPDAQYLEIYNTTDTAKWIHTLTLLDPQSACTLPKYLLPPKAFLVLHNNPDSAFNYLKNNAIRITNLPHFNIDGDELALMYNRDTIHKLRYSDKWYHPLYKGGGYALEKTDLTCGCINNFNWHCNHENGGTPGERNSKPLPWPSPRPVDVKSEPPTIRIIEHRWQSNDILEVICNHQPEIPNFTADSTLNSRLPQLILISNQGDTIQTTYHRTTSKGWLFKIKTTKPLDGKAVMRNAKDCAHRKLNDTQFQVNALVKQPQPGELQFNEIMFNASDESVDYIELVNTSNNAIQLQGLELLNHNDQQLTQRTLLCPEPKTLYPNQMICFSGDPYSLAKMYNPEKYTFHQLCSTFPNFSASGAELQLTFNYSPNIIDIMQYDESMHHSLLIETKGVSLEKNHPKAPSSSPQFWLSATSSVGYGTPAESNSQQVNLKTSNRKTQKRFSLLNTVIGDDPIDNKQNTLMLMFQMPQPGYILTASIYNLHGGLMGVPIYQAIISKEGVLPIPITMSNVTLSNGNYILHIDAFHREADICTQNLRWIYMKP